MLVNVHLYLHYVGQRDDVKKEFEDAVKAFTPAANAGGWGDASQVSASERNGDTHSAPVTRDGGNGAADGAESNNIVTVGRDSNIQDDWSQGAENWAASKQTPASSIEDWTSGAANWNRANNSLPTIPATAQVTGFENSCSKSANSQDSDVKDLTRGTTDVKPVAMSSSQGCRSCGATDHFVKDCPQCKCFKCNKMGHMAKACTESSDRPVNNDACRNCKQSGHFTKDCSQPLTCNSCGEIGHIRRDCPNWVPTNKQNCNCHNCGLVGHSRRDCPDPPKDGNPNVTCYNCNRPGHTKRDCQDAPKDGYPNMICYSCNLPGHTKRDCPSANPADTRACHGCGLTGHIRRDCLTPHEDRRGARNIDHRNYTDAQAARSSAGNGGWETAATTAPATVGNWDAVPEGLELDLSTFKSPSQPFQSDMQSQDEGNIREYGTNYHNRSVNNQQGGDAISAWSGATGANGSENGGETGRGGPRRGKKGHEDGVDNEHVDTYSEGEECAGKVVEAKIQLELKRKGKRGQKSSKSYYNLTPFLGL